MRSMADADHDDKREHRDDLDLSRFYREDPGRGGPESAQSSRPLDAFDYHRPDEDNYGPDGQSDHDQYAHDQYAQDQYVRDAYGHEYAGHADGYHEGEEPQELSPDFLPTFDSAPAWHPARAAEELARAQAAEAARAAEAAAAEQAAVALESPVEDEPEPEVAHSVQPQTVQLVPGLKIPANWKQNPIVRFAVVGGFLGIVFGACLIGFAWLFAKPEGPYDLGNATLTAVGLKGHLYTKWEDDKLQYRLSMEPSDSEYLPGLTFALKNPPHPLSFGIQLKDAMGFVLCTREIVLKYNPAAPALLAAESQREQGKDIVQEMIGSDGQIASLVAQGQIPCSDKAYGKVVAWNLTPDFPSLTEQKDLMKQQAEREANEERQAAARRRGPQKNADKTLTFSIEGDDSVVGYDATSNVLETGTGESFYIDKKELAAGSVANWPFPVRIHYRCDQTSFCTLIRAGSGTALHAKMRR